MSTTQQRLARGVCVALCLAGLTLFAQDGGQSGQSSLAADAPGASRLEVKNQQKTERQLIDEALDSVDAVDRGNALQELERRWHAHIAKLIEIAGDKKAPPMRRVYAIRLLGLFSDRAAIPVLVDNLDWEYRDDVVNDASWTNIYPCVKALLQFGEEGAISILRTLARTEERETNDRMVRLRADVLRSIYARGHEPWGRDDVTGVVERYIERIPADWPAARANVRRLLVDIKEGMRTHRPPGRLLDVVPKN